MICWIWGGALVIGCWMLLMSFMGTNRRDAEDAEVEREKERREVIILAGLYSKERNS